MHEMNFVCIKSAVSLVASVWIYCIINFKHEKLQNNILKTSTLPCL